MLFNEPKLLKYHCVAVGRRRQRGFSALQRAEIAEMVVTYEDAREIGCFSALQRAEIAEIRGFPSVRVDGRIVSVLFNEPKLLKYAQTARFWSVPQVSVLFNEPKLLKWCTRVRKRWTKRRFSALQRAEIAEIVG